jgi:cysteine-rich repeat protein
MKRLLLVSLAVSGGCAAEPVPDLPPLIADQALWTLEDVPIWFRVTATDPEARPVSTIIAAPEHGILRATPGGWTYEPAREWSGTEHIVVRASDGIAESTAVVEIRVIPVNDRPQALADRFGTPEDVPLVIDPAVLVANDLDLEGATLQIVAVGEADSGSVELVDGMVHFTPAREMAGTVRFRYTVSDGEVTDTAGVIVEVGAVNDPPHAVSIATSTVEDKSVYVKLAATDVDSSALGYAIAQPPAHGTAVLTGGEVQYLPAPDYHGLDTFTYVVDDGQDLSAPAMVVIDVAAVDECGDVEVSGDEQCDDGNALDGDGCDQACVASGCGNGVRASFLATEVELRWLATACDGPNELVFSLGGVEVLRTVAAPEGCTCLPGVQSVVLTAPEVMALVDGDVDFEVSVPGRTLLAWAHAYVSDATGVRTVVVFDQDGVGEGGDPTNLCTQGSTEDGHGWTRGHFGEDCDDGNTVDGDGCSATCSLE